MLWKLLLSFALIFETIDAGKTKQSDKNVSFSVEKIWQSFKKKDECCSCLCDDDKWKAGVQQYYDGSRKATWKFRGRSYDLADVVIKSFEDYLTKLIYFTNTNSTVLTSSSTAILESLSKCNKLGKSSQIIMKEFNKVLPALVVDFNEVVVTKLSDVIDQVTCPFNNAVLDLSYELSNFLNKFIQCSGTECRSKVNYEPVFKKCQKLMNTVALMAETLLNECESPTREVYEAVTILTLIFYYLLLAVQGINSCAQDMLYEDKCAVSRNIESCSMSLDFVVVEVTHAVSGVIFPFDKTIDKMFTTLVNITMAFNTAVKDILGVFDGVGITIGKIKRNLSKSIKHSATEVEKEQTNILKGVVPK